MILFITWNQIDEIMAWNFIEPFNREVQYYPGLFLLSWSIVSFHVQCSTKNDQSSSGDTVEKQGRLASNQYKPPTVDPTIREGTRSEVNLERWKAEDHNDGNHRRCAVSHRTHVVMDLVDRPKVWKWRTHRRLNQLRQPIPHLRQLICLCRHQSPKKKKKN